ncbi:MAG TPA: hypothetical protein VFR58_00815 [Flavisolibacter sp.]|nr:hypothetical protein [Flavisolibacter sp.]
MHTEMNTVPGEGKGSNQKTDGNTSENVQISLPKNDRPEGPFEHSGETAGWTEAEEQEIRQKDQQQESGQGQ